MSRLQVHLQSSGKLDEDSLAAAVAHQHAEGGSLDTALLELGLMTALELDTALPTACGLPAVPSALLERTTNRPWEAIPPDLQEVGWVFPLARDGTRVLAATHPDLPDDRLGKLYREVAGFSPMVTAECCMARLHAERSGTFMAARYAELAVRYLELLKRRDSGRRKARSSQLFLVEETAKRLQASRPKHRAPDPAVVLAKQISKPRTRLSLAREADRVTEALARAATIIAPRVALFGVKREGLRVLTAPGSSLRIEAGKTITVRAHSKVERAILGDSELRRTIPLGLRTCLELTAEVPCIFEPVYVHGRCVLMLYIDRKGQDFTRGELLAARDLCDVAGRSLEEVLKLKHHKATIGSDLNVPRRRSSRRAPVVPADGSRVSEIIARTSTASQAVLVIPRDLTRRESSEAHLAAAGGSSLHIPTVRRARETSPPEHEQRPVTGEHPASSSETAIPSLVKPTRVPEDSGEESSAPAVSEQTTPAPAKPSHKDNTSERSEKPDSADRQTPGHDEGTQTPAGIREDTKASAGNPDGTSTREEAQTLAGTRDGAQTPANTRKRAETKTSSKPRRPSHQWPDTDSPNKRKRAPSRKSRHTPSARRDAEIDAAIAEYTIAGTSISRLRALGTRALLRLATSFPGPLDIAEVDLSDLPPPAEHGPLLRACIELGEAMVPHILELFDHRRYLVRFYAAFVFQDLRDPRCVRPLGELAFDNDASVRLISMRVLETYSQSEEFQKAVGKIRKSLNSVDRPRRVQAIDALGTLRDIRSIPQLIDLLEATDTEVQDTALGALCSVTAQQLGYRASRWRTWYAGHSDQHRIDWLIEGLRHRDPAVRQWVADELSRITNQEFEFPADGDRREREQAIKTWSMWWAEAREQGAAS